MTAPSGLVDWRPRSAGRSAAADEPCDADRGSGEGMERRTQAAVFAAKHFGH